MPKKSKKKVHKNKSFLPENADFNPLNWLQNIGNINTAAGYNLTTKDFIQQALDPRVPDIKGAGGQSERNAFRQYLGLSQTGENRFEPSPYKEGSFQLRGYEDEFPEDLSMFSDERIDKMGHYKDEGNPIKPFGDITFGRHSVKRVPQKDGGFYLETNDDWNLDPEKQLKGTLKFEKKKGTNYRDFKETPVTRVLDSLGETFEEVVFNPFNASNRIYYDKNKQKVSGRPLPYGGNTMGPTPLTEHRDGGTVSKYTDGEEVENEDSWWRDLEQSSVGKAVNLRGLRGDAEHAFHYAKSLWPESNLDPGTPEGLDDLGYSPFPVGEIADATNMMNSWGKGDVIGTVGYMAGLLPFVPGVVAKNVIKDGIKEGAKAVGKHSGKTARQTVGELPRKKGVSRKNVSVKTIPEEEAFKQGYLPAGIQKELAEGAKSLRKALEERIQNLKSPEGQKRLIKQEEEYLRSIGYPENRMWYQAKANANARIKELEGMTTLNDEFTDPLTREKAVELLKDDRLRNNAFYMSPPKIKGLDESYDLYRPSDMPSDVVPDEFLQPIGGETFTAGKIGIGIPFTNKKAVIDHEIAHALQKNRILPIDDDARKLIPIKKNLTKTQKKAYKYFKEGSDELEPSAFLNELRSSLKEFGFIQHEYDEITDQTLKEAYAYFKKNPSVVTYKAKSDPGLGSMSQTRIFDFMEASQDGFNAVRHLLNRLPAVVPALGAASIYRSTRGQTENTVMEHGGEVGDKRDSDYLDWLSNQEQSTLTDPRYPRDTDIMSNILEARFPEIAGRRSIDIARKYIYEPTVDHRRSEIQQEAAGAVELPREMRGRSYKPKNMDETGLRPEVPFRYTATSIDNPSQGYDKGGEVGCSECEKAKYAEGGEVEEQVGPPEPEEYEVDINDADSIYGAALQNRKPKIPEELEKVFMDTPDRDREYIIEDFMTERYNTELSDLEMQHYALWMDAGWANPKDIGVYDIQGYWKSNAWKDNTDPDNHGSDTYKKPSHPTFSDESQYSAQKGGSEFIGGRWREDGGFLAGPDNMYTNDRLRWEFSREKNRPEYLYTGTPVVEVSPKDIGTQQKVQQFDKGGEVTKDGGGEEVENETSKIHSPVIENGTNIRVLQRFLNEIYPELGKLGEGLIEDGIWGEKTYTLYQKFKTDYPKSKGKTRRNIREGAPVTGFLEATFPGAMTTISALADDIFRKQVMNYGPNDRPPVRTEGDFTDDQVNVLRDITRKNLAAGKSYIDYKDYDAVRPSQAYRADSGIRTFGSLLGDPGFQTQSVLGRASIVTTPETFTAEPDTLVLDTYNFNNDAYSHLNRGGTPIDNLKEATGKALSPYGIVRNMAQYFGSQEGDTSAKKYAVRTNQ